MSTSENIVALFIEAMMHTADFTYGRLLGPWTLGPRSQVIDPRSQDCRASIVFQ